MELAIAVIPADDLSVMKKFYVEGLGFEAHWEVSEDGKTGLLGVKRGAMEITIDCPMEGHGRGACVSLHVADADRYYEEWKDKVAILRAPKDEEWGARTFDLIDPAGNTIFVIGPGKDSVAS